VADRAEIGGIEIELHDEVSTQRRAEHIRRARMC
jgi:hypothetical protein